MKKLIVIAVVAVLVLTFSAGAVRLQSLIRQVLRQRPQEVWGITKVSPILA